jgi:phage terminase large subunit GpA-like protein
MLQHSGLEHLIKSADETNTRKTGKRDDKIEWIGGGFLIPIGAQNANKLRSASIQILLRDEIDGWPLVVGKDGDPIELSAARTNAYGVSRKVVDLSTPTIKGISKIEQRFALGDQRRYYVCCLRCGFAQTLRWRRVDPDTGEVTGITWQMDGGRLVPDSVRYRCVECGHDHENDDKTRLLSPENGAEWRPTAEPSSPHFRSYHLSALYSPVGMMSWTDCVQKWLEAWDEEKSRPRDVAKLQVFYNTVLGDVFEVRGEQLRFEEVSATRRTTYCYGQVPNKFAKEHCGSEVLLVTCTVDVHKNQLPTAIVGWCRDRRALLLDYWRFEGDTEQLDDPTTWRELEKKIEQHIYEADDGRRYRPQLTLIDSGYRADTVYRFAAAYQSGVVPVKGRELPAGGATREFAAFQTPMGTQAFNIFVDLYKDRWSAALRRKWHGEGLQPVDHFNAPVDATDDQLRELTAEIKRERIDRVTRKRLGFEWFRPSGSANELWDLLIYANAALDIAAWDVCRRQLGLEAVDWPMFWDLLERERIFEERR